MTCKKRRKNLIFPVKDNSNNNKNSNRQVYELDLHPTKKKHNSNFKKEKEK